MPHENLHALIDTIERALVETPSKSVKPGERQGIIESYKDGVVVIKGLQHLKMGEVVTIDATGTNAVILNLDKDKAYGVVLELHSEIKEGLLVTAHDIILSIPVSEEIVGRVVDPLGTPLDKKPVYKAKERYPLEKIAPGVMVRKSVSRPVQTGILAIDALIPIGRGQRELIIGDRQTGKSTVALDTIINQKGQNMICVYVGVGQREAKSAQVWETLKEHGAMEYTTIVLAPASSSAVLKFLAPFAGIAIAEYFMAQGKDVLVVFDDLSKHAVAYREMSLLLRRPSGREAYPGDVFYLHSRLLERAAQLNEENGGGSITALPIIETQAGDVSAYIPTNVISITDGQIFLDTNLFYKNIRPAINVGISVSRVGGAAQTKIMKKVAGSAKLALAQYYELEAFSQFASELDESTQNQLKRGKRIVEALRQKNGHPYALWQEVMVLLAATRGYLDTLEIKDCTKQLQELLAFMETKHQKTIDEILEVQDLTPALEKKIVKVLDTFFTQK